MELWSIKPVSRYPSCKDQSHWPPHCCPQNPPSGPVERKSNKCKLVMTMVMFGNCSWPTKKTTQMNVMWNIKQNSMTGGAGMQVTSALSYVCLYWSKSTQAVCPWQMLMEKPKFPLGIYIYIYIYKLIKIKEKQVGIKVPKFSADAFLVYIKQWQWWVWQEPRQIN